MRVTHIFKNTMLRRYFLSFTLIIAFPIFLILVFLFGRFETILVAYLSQQSLEAMRQFAQGIDEEAKRIALLTSVLANNQEFLALIYAYAQTTDRDARYLISRRIAEQLDMFFNYTNQVGGVFFFFKDQDSVYHRNALISFGPASKQTPWYQKALQVKGQTHMLPTLALGAQGASAELFLSCAICPGAEALAQGLELIVVSFKSRAYSEHLLKQDQAETAQSVILNAENKVIWGRETPGNRHVAFLAPLISEGSQTIAAQQGKFLAISAFMPYMGMRIIRLFDYAQFTKSVQQYSWYARGTLAVLVALFFIYTGIFFRSLIRPIRKVIVYMEQVGQGDMQVQVETTGLAELKVLGETFNRMVAQIRQLTKQIEYTERQRAQAEIEALQAQINPHFLSNTLNAIKMMAMLVGAENIRKMTGALMSILTESFGQDGALITLEKELDNLAHYVYIMKVRFGDSFDVTFEIQDEIKHVGILKMLLQPILENAILHGVNGLEKKGEIRIKGWRQEGQLVLAVVDNGVGMSPETLCALWERQPHPHKGLHGIGIRNVHERIRLNYGEAYGLHIQSVAAQGVTVTFVLPMLAGSGEMHV